MKNIEGFRNTENTDPMDDYINSLAIFLEDEKYTAKEVEEAYHEMLGIGSEESSERINALAKKMNEMTDAGFPLNKLVSLIGLKSDWENMVPDYYSFVDGLSISDNEKVMLKSIIEKDRAGEISIYVDGENIADLKVDIAKSDEAKAYQLETALRAIIESIPSNKKYEVSFSEN